MIVPDMQHRIPKSIFMTSSQRELFTLIMQNVWLDGYTEGLGFGSTPGTCMDTRFGVDEEAEPKLVLYPNEVRVNGQLVEGPLAGEVAACEGIHNVTKG